MSTQVVFAEAGQKTPRAWAGADEYQEQCERLRRRFAPRPPAKTVSIADLCRAYEEATGTWTGCD